MSLHPRVAGNAALVYVPRREITFVMDLGYLGHALERWCEIDLTSRAMFSLANGLYHIGPNYKPVPVSVRGKLQSVAPSKYYAYLEQEAILLGLQRRAGRSKSRCRTEVIVRGRVFKRLREEGYSWPGLARAAGVDHTTAIAIVKRITMLENISSFARAIEPHISAFGFVKWQKWRPRVRFPA